MSGRPALTEDAARDCAFALLRLVARTDYAEQTADIIGIYARELGIRALPDVARTLAGVPRDGVRINVALACILLAAVAGGLARWPDTGIGPWLLPLNAALFGLVAASFYRAAADTFHTYPATPRRTLAALSFYVIACVVATTYVSRILVAITVGWLDHLASLGSVRFTDRGYFDFQVFMTGFVALFFQLPTLVVAINAVVRQRRDPPYGLLWLAVAMAFVGADAFILANTAWESGAPSAFGSPDQVTPFLPAGTRPSVGVTYLIQSCTIVLSGVVEALIAVTLIRGMRSLLNRQDQRVLQLAYAIVAPERDELPPDVEAPA
jgi:hypothetical protein